MNVGAGSVSFWLARLKAGSTEAAQPLWERYFRQLVTRARQRLLVSPCRAADAEDVALEAFASFCRAVEQDRFPKLDDRDDLWQLLIVISDRKANAMVRSERRQRRGGGRVLDEAALRDDGSNEGSPLAQIAGQEPTPAFVNQVADECDRLLGLLRSPELRWLALRKMEGFTVEEIAGQLGCVSRTVKRRLQVIRRLWQAEVGA
jgi:DNA-directed RNA polymerase specialized sigma24 family protein